MFEEIKKVVDRRGLKVLTLFQDLTFPNFLFNFLNCLYRLVNLSYYDTASAGEPSKRSDQEAKQFQVH